MPISGWRTKWTVSPHLKKKKKERKNGGKKREKVNRQSWVRVYDTLSLPFHVTSGVRKALSWGLFFSTYSLMTYVTINYFNF
jgi:hypothetical protein